MVIVMEPVTCPECLQKYTSKDAGNRKMQPLLLGCGHSLCENCLRSSLKAKRDITCKNCDFVKQFDPEMSEDNVHSFFPFDQYTCGRLSGHSTTEPKRKGEFKRKIIRRNENRSNAKRVQCLECAVRYEEFKCKQCNAGFCNPCFDMVHNAGRSLKFHEKLPLQVENSQIISKGVYCPEHKNHKMEFFCKDCSVKICSTCGLINHQCHKIVRLKDENESKLEAINDAMEKAIQTQKRLLFTKKKAISSLETDESPSINCSQLKNRISMHFQHLHGLLQIRENQLLDVVCKYENEQLNSLNEVIDKLTSSLQESEQVLSEAKLALHPDNLEYIDSGPLLNSLQGIGSKPCFLDLTESKADNNPDGANENDDDKANRLLFTSDNNVADILKEYGTIHLPAGKKYVLKAEVELPSDYDVEPIPEDTQYDFPTMEDGIPETVVSAMGSLTVKSTDNESLRSQSIHSGSDMSVVSSFSENLNSIAFACKQKPRDKHRADSSMKLSAASVAKEMSKMIPNTFHDLPPGTLEEVQICHITNPSNFYVHRKNANFYLEEIASSVGKIIHLKSIPKFVKTGFIYLVKYSKDGKWYRARALNDINKDKIPVFFIDYGNEEVVQLKSLRYAPEKIIQLPQLATKCQLYSCHPSPGPEWNPEATKLMTMMCGVFDTFRIQVVSNEPNMKLGVDLKCYKNGSCSSLRDTLLFHGFATFSSSSSSIFTRSLFNQTVFNPNKLTFESGKVLNAVVSHVEDPSNFFIRPDKQYFEQLLQEMNTFYSQRVDPSSRVFSPVIGMAAAVFVDEDSNWYRAMVVAHPGNKLVQVNFVDIGRIATVSWEKLRILEIKFARLPFFAVKCTLFGVSPMPSENQWPVATTQFFKDMTLEIPLQVHVIEKKKDYLSVVIYTQNGVSNVCVNELLLEKELAASNSLITPFVQNKPMVAKRNLKPKKQPQFEQTVNEPKYKPRKMRKYEMEQKSFSPASSIAASYESVQQEPDEQLDDQGKLDKKRFPCSVIKIIDPSHFYIMFDAEKFQRIKKEMTEFYSVESNKKEYEKKEEWKEGDVSAFLNKDSFWYRAVIANLSPDGKAELLVKDIAEKVTVQTSELLELKKDFKAYVEISVRCHLCDVGAPGGAGLWPSITIEEFEEHLSTRKVYFMQKGEVDVAKKSVPIELWIKTVKEPGPFEPAVNEWYTVNKYLIDKGLALPISSADVSTSFSKSLSPEKKNTEDENNQKPQEETKIEEALASIVPKKIKQSSKNNEKYVSPGIKDWIPALPLESLKFSTSPTYVDHDANIYLQEPSSYSTLHILETSLLSKYRNSKPLPHDSFWSAGQLCIALYHADAKWYRGKVLEVLPDRRYKVVMVDYGNIETCKASDLRKNLLMTEIPIQCHCCKLADLKPISEDGKWTVPVLDYIHSTIVDRPFDIELRGSVGNYAITNLQVLPGMTLASLLLELQYATYALSSSFKDSLEDILDSCSSDSEDITIEKVVTTGNNSGDLKSSDNEQQKTQSTFEAVVDCESSVANLSWLEIMEQETKETLEKVSHDGLSQKNYTTLVIPPGIEVLEIESLCILSPTIFYVVFSGKSNVNMMRVEFIAMQDEIQSVAEDLPKIQNPYEGQLCCSKFVADNKWYRGKVLRVTGDSCSVKYVDVGNTQVVPSKEIREIKPEWLEIPVQGLQCKLWKIEVNPDADIGDCVSILNSKLFESPSPIFASIKSYDPLLVSLHTKNNELVYQDLLDKSLFVSTE